VLLPRLGPRALIATGMLFGTGGMAYLTQVTVTSSYASSVLPPLLILGLGFGMIFAPAINTATFGVARRDSGVASALVNTMQQVGGSIGVSALSTIALTATASYLVAHHTSPLAPAVAATHGYTLSFAVSAGLLGVGCILTILLLPSRRRAAELRRAAATTMPPAAAPAGSAPAATAASAQAADAASPAAASSASAPAGATSASDLDGATSASAPAAERSAAAPAAASAPPLEGLQHGFEAIPVALCSCSPVVSRAPGLAVGPSRDM
jgi:hypothetical protein